MLFFICLILEFIFCAEEAFVSPGNFSDGTFGTWSMKRVPYPPPSTKSLEIVDVGGTNLVYYQLRKDDPLKSGSSRVELSVPDNFFENPGQIEEVYFYTQFFPGGIWLNETAEANTTASVIAQFHAVNGLSPPVGVRILNSGKMAISVNSVEGRKYLYIKAPPAPGTLFMLRFLINWSVDPKVGFMKVWLDEELIIDYNGNVGEQGSPYYYFKYGIYNPTNYEFIPEDFVLKLYHGPYYHRYLK